jgi:hypothetical protein
VIRLVLGTAGRIGENPVFVVSSLLGQIRLVLGTAIFLLSCLSSLFAFRTVRPWRARHVSGFVAGSLADSVLLGIKINYIIIIKSRSHPVKSE